MAGVEGKRLEEPDQRMPFPNGRADTVSGRVAVRTEDGTEMEFGPGAVIAIAPGHDTWTVGDEPAVFVDFGAALG